MPSRSRRLAGPFLDGGREAGRRGDHGRCALPRRERGAGVRAGGLRRLRRVRGGARRRSVDVVRLRLRSRRPRGAARGRGPRRAARRDRRRVRDRRAGHIRRDAQDDRPCDGTAAGCMGGPPRSVEVRKDVAQRAFPVRRSLRDRVGRNGASDGSAAHARASRPLLLRSASRRRARGARRTAHRAVRAPDRPSRREPVRGPRGGQHVDGGRGGATAAARAAARRWSARDTYGLAALLVAHGARALRDGEARGVGALAPAEAFDVQTFAPRLAPLLEIAAVESF